MKPSRRLCRKRERRKTPPLPPSSLHLSTEILTIISLSPYPTTDIMYENAAYTKTRAHTGKTCPRQVQEHPERTARREDQGCWAAQPYLGDARPQVSPPPPLSPPAPSRGTLRPPSPGHFSLLRLVSATCFCAIHKTDRPPSPSTSQSYLSCYDFEFRAPSQGQSTLHADQLLEFGKQHSRECRCWWCFEGRRGGGGELDFGGVEIWGLWNFVSWDVGRNFCFYGDGFGFVDAYEIINVEGWECLEKIEDHGAAILNGDDKHSKI